MWINITLILDVTMISDDTLREGLQTPGFALTIEEKLKIAGLLHDTGIRRALVSYPSAHASESAVTRKIVDGKYFEKTFALGRALKADIDAIAETGSNISLHFPFIYKDLGEIMENIRYATKKGHEVEVSIVDIGKYEIPELIKVAKMVESAGADVIQFPDTTGMLTPKDTGRILSSVLKEIKCESEVHFHNDMGLSVANALAAFSENVDYIDVSVMGLGERNGISDLASIYGGIKDRVNERLDMEALSRLYEYVFTLIAKKIGINYFYGKLPLVGPYLGTSTAGTHAAASSVFSVNRFSVNVYAGRAMIREILRRHSMEISDASLNVLLAEIKNASVERGMPIREDEIVNMAGGYQ